MNPQQKQQLSPNQSQPVDRLKLEIIPLKGGVDGSMMCVCGTLCGVTLGSFADEE